MGSHNPSAKMYIFELNNTQPWTLGASSIKDDWVEEDGFGGFVNF